MSAFICSDKHINSIVRFASNTNAVIYSGNPSLRWCVSGNERHTASMLHAENVKSVNYRYLQDAPDSGIIYDHRAPELRPIEVIKAIDCLAYQSCEHPDWELSAANELLKEIQRKAVSLLPGYESARWEIAA
ncbi:MAG: hypothetical protein IPH37_10690 [Burkholderiales bacterium]|nr:hypothetical protein [Burkholderiales bacterium]